MFQDEDAMSKTDSDKDFLTSPDETFYFGLLIEYDSGEGTRKRELGSIFTASKDKTTCLRAWTE